MSKSKKTKKTKKTQNARNGRFAKNGKRFDPAAKDRARAQKAMRDNPNVLKEMLLVAFRPDGTRNKGISQAIRAYDRKQSYLGVALLKQLVGLGYLRAAKRDEANKKQNKRRAQERPWEFCEYKLTKKGKKLIASEKLEASELARADTMAM